MLSHSVLQVLEALQENKAVIEDGMKAKAKYVWRAAGVGLRGMGYGHGAGSSRYILACSQLCATCIC